VKQFANFISIQGLDRATGTYIIVAEGF